MKRMLRCLCLSLVVASSAFADQAGAVTTIKTLRPYLNGTVYVYVSSAAFCNTSAFTISDVGSAAGKAMYAAALSAYLTGSGVLLETSAPCNPGAWGMALQSIYLCAFKEPSNQCWP